MSGPVASTLVLLSALASCTEGTKVRFLGCVDEYIIRTGILRLKHDYPKSDKQVIANVDVEHVLERIKRHELEVGTWINVIGHVQHREEKGIFVQAVTIWDAGNVDLAAYEKAAESRMAAI